MPRRDAVDIIAQAKREAEAFAHEARAKLSETLERRSRQAEQKIAQAEAQAVKEVRNIATDLAVAAAGHLIGDAAKGADGHPACRRRDLAGEVEAELS